MMQRPRDLERDGNAEITTIQNMVYSMTGGDQWLMDKICFFDDYDARVEGDFGSYVDVENEYDTHIEIESVFRKADKTPHNEKAIVEFIKELISYDWELYGWELSHYEEDGHFILDEYVGATFD